MAVSVTITSDAGIVVKKDCEETPGVYIGTDVPHFMPDHVNVFVAENFTAAKQAAAQWVQDIIFELEGVLLDLKDTRVRHAQ